MLFTREDDPNDDDSDSAPDCRSLCDSKTVKSRESSPGRKRGWVDFNSGAPIGKRAWPNPPWPNKGDDAGRDAWMVRECNALTDATSIAPDWVFDDDWASITTDSFGTQPIRRGTHGLCGCTSLIVVSRKRYYLGESP